MRVSWHQKLRSVVIPRVFLGKPVNRLFLSSDWEVDDLTVEVD